jgi:phage-related protein
MSLPVFTFCPEFGAREIRAPRTSPFQFGNGKERRYRFGLITDLRTWELTFDYNADAEREEILAFLEERGAWKVFEWTDPKGYLGRWRCKEWRTTWNGPRRHVIVCTFLEVDERAVLEAEPPSGVLADMWMSRVTTPIQRAIKSTATLTDDGGSYQTAWVEEQDDVGIFDLYVIRRNREGIVQWQRKLSNCALNTAQLEQPYICTNGVDLYVLHYGNASFGITTWVGQGSLSTLYAQKVNADGSLAWQKQYFMDDGIGSPSSRSFEIKDAIYDPISQNIKVAGVLNPIFSSKSRLFIFSLALSNGALVNLASFEDVLQLTSTNFLELFRINMQIRSGRLIISCGNAATTVKYNWIAEFSLDLATIFVGYRFSGFDLSLLYPASDGGFYALHGSWGGSLPVDDASICKLTSSYTPIWRQTPSVGDYHRQDDMVHISVGKAGQILYRAVKAPLSSLFKNGVTGAGNNNFVICKYDHEAALSGLQATASSPGGQSIDFPSNRAGHEDGSGRTLCVDEDKNIALGWCTLSNTFNVQGYKLLCYGHKAFFPDEAERFMDTGLSENSLFFMATRSQLDGQFQPVEVDNVNNLPVRADYIPPVLTGGEITVEDTTYEWLNGTLNFAYYSYSDPEYTAPAAVGSANLVFYEGNNAVQRISVERSFEPALLIIANRASSTHKTVFNTFFDPRFYQAWAGTRPSVTVDGLVELAQGNFKVAGRMDSLNLAGNNFAALALGAIAGAHEIVSYVGTNAVQVIPHSLGAAPTFVLFQGDVTNDGIVLAGTALGGSGLNYSTGDSTDVVTSSTSFIGSLGSSSIEVGTSLSANGFQYRMHVFQSSSDWTIDNVSGPGTGTLTVSLGFQPKAILFKGATGVGTAWQLLYRPDGTTGVAKSLPLNAGSAVEADSTFASITADGFTILEGGPGNTGSSSAFYLAINTTSGQTPGNVQIPSASITVNPLAFTVAGTSSVAMPAVNVTVTALAPIQNNVPIPAVDITVTGLDPVQNNVPIPVVDVTVEALAPTLSL